VKGSLFLDYVRMLKARKGVDWSTYLAPEDLPYLDARIDPAGWYPMATFERLGLAILETIAAGDLEGVRAWGQISVRPLASLHGDLLVGDDPRESLMRFHVVRRALFDFEAVKVQALSDTEARLEITYGMAPAAEEAAAYQTMGFFEGMLELAGGRNVDARFAQRSWAGDARTVLVVRWAPPARRG
jgi:uncharacterized protein (TIGR02265 family)